MTSVDVPVALLGYGTVGAAVNRMLSEGGDDIERATGHRLRVVKALVRDPGRERDFPTADGVLTTDFAEIMSDDSIALVAEVMGGLEPTGGYVLDLLRAGKPVVSANKQLLARRSAELFAAASEAGVQLRFEASVCAAIPVIKVLRESLVATHVHRVLGIVNGTTNFILTRMESGASYEDALAEAQRLGYAEADPAEDVNGADAAAKMAILATVAFGSRVLVDDVAYEGIEGLRQEHVEAARSLGAVVRLVGTATLVGDAVDVRVGPALVDKEHPLASVAGAFNAVMLQGDAIRELMLEGPGAGGIETASAIVADLVSVLGTTGTGFLQGDASWRTLAKLPPGELPASYYVRIEVADRPGVLAHVAERFAEEGVSIARLTQHLVEGAAALDVVTHTAPSGRLEAALDSIAALPEVNGRPAALRWSSSEGSDARLDAGALPHVPAAVGGDAARVARRGRDAARARPTGSRSGSASTSGSSGRAPTRPARSRIAAWRSRSRRRSRAARPASCARPPGTRPPRPPPTPRGRGSRPWSCMRPEAVAAGKVIQVRAAGARLVPVDGSFDDAFAAAIELAEREGYTIVNSTNPHRLEGQKTAAFEIVEQLGATPDVLALPYGGGGNTTAYFKGFGELGEPLPRLVPVQAAARLETVASAIRIGEPVHAHEVEQAVAATGGEVVTVDDSQIVAAWRALAREEGVFCEPASAAAVAGLEQGVEAGARVVCVVTGHGLKDTASFDELADEPARPRAGDDRQPRPRLRLRGRRARALERGRDQRRLERT